jgi:D-cysteine desulfhydrase
MAQIQPPAKISLARLSTPLEPLRAASEALGIELWIKRDDLTGSQLSGNKVRKLEYLLADARAADADVVLTCGGEQSNHCRATAIAARRQGLDSVLFLRTANPDRPPASTGNILLDRMVGAEVRWITPAQYGERMAMMEAAAEQLRAAGRRPYVIPEGGSNAIGCWGYVGCAAELAVDLAALPRKRTTVVYACGSGGTGAGLVLGRKLTDLANFDVELAGFNVCDDRDYFLDVIGRLCREFDDAYGTSAGIKEADIGLVDGYVGRGYAKSRPEELAEIIALGRRDGIVLDPVYTGKAYYGLTRELASGRDFGERVVFLHTGGIFGLLGKAGELEEHLG